jgi:hypothetical protein
MHPYAMTGNEAVTSTIDHIILLSINTMKMIIGGSSRITVRCT